MSFQCQLRTDLYANAMSVSAVRTAEGDNQLAISQVIPAATTNLLILAAIDVSQVKMIVMQADVACTIKTNSSGSPANTINLVAGVPYIWAVGDYNSLLLTTDVSALYVTVAGAAECNLQILALIDV